MSTTTKLVSLINIARLREARKLGIIQHRCMSQFAAIEVTEYEEPEREQTTTRNTDIEEARQSMQGIQMKTNWVPHPRSGIYYPEGHDEVMNDVSENAASLGQSRSFWLRNIHGAEKHDPDLVSADDYFLTSTPDYDA